MYYLAVIILFIISCSTAPKSVIKTEQNKNIKIDISGSKEYQLSDLSGTFRLTREVYKKSGKMYFESRLLNPNKTDEILEKSQVVLKYSNHNGKNILVPIISQFTTWIEKQKYFTEIKIDSKKKVYRIYTTPENKKSEQKFIDSDWICPFSILPECLNLSGFIASASKGEWVEKSIWVMWDIYPYQQKFYENVSPAMFEKTNLIFDGIKDDYYQFSVEISGQSISLLYTPGYKFEKMIWVAQGLSLTLQ